MIAPDHTNLETAVSPAVFFPIENQIDTYLPCVNTAERNIRANIGRALPKLHERPDFGKWKGGPMAIVAGGPSLRRTCWELPQFENIMVCGTPHDFLLSLGIVPTHAVFCESIETLNEGTLDYLRRPQPACEYFVASSCHPRVFEALKDYRVCMWNNYGGVDDAAFNGEPAITGGCTVTLRAINIAIALGFYDLHFFGLDSSYEDEKHNHAYAVGPATMAEKTIPVRVGSADGREFKTNPTFLAQAHHFQEMVSIGLFRPFVHGDGLIAEIMRQRESKQ